MADAKKILLAGDVMLGRLVNRELERHPPEYPWGDTLPLFQEADWRICNLECVLSDQGEPWTATPKTFHFRSAARNVAVLKAAGINAVSLANNHTLDFGFEAMFEMLRLLDDADVFHSGAGHTLEAAATPIIRNVGSLTVGFVAFTDNEHSWESKPDRPGIFYLPVNLGDPRANRLLEIARATKSRVDLLIVSAHWGPNWGYLPPPSQIPFGHALVDAGADLVFGHSGHVVRGIETYKDRPIIYSAGDFVDDYAVDEVERNDRSFIFIVEACADGIRSVELRPTVIRNFQARLAPEWEAELSAAKMRELCAAFNTPSEWDSKTQRLIIPIKSAVAPV